MEFHVSCQCGQSVRVLESAAERTIECACGRAIAVPPLTMLRRQAGLPPYNVSPEIMIDHLLPLGRLPGSNVCTQCGAETDHRIQILTECERLWIHRSGGLSWAALLAFFLLPFSILLREKTEVKEFGKDKVYSLPCPSASGVNQRCAGGKPSCGACTRFRNTAACWTSFRMRR